MKISFFAVAIGLSFGLLPFQGAAQDRLKTLPGYERYQRMSRELTNAVKLGSLSITWTNQGKAFTYQTEGKRYLYDIAQRQATELGPGQAPRRRFDRGRRPDSGQSPGRGRQFASATSPDGRYKALYRNRNLWLSDTNGGKELAITEDGSDKSRVKSGAATWTYGEELYQTTAIWWSSNSQKVAFYRFDESKVPDYYLTLNQTKWQSTLEVEPYPLAGSTNPVVDLFIYDVATRCTTKVDVRDGHPFDDSVVGHYVYGISWAADGKQLLFHRANRRQNILEYCAADAESGKCRVVVHEEWLPSWVDNLPSLRFLEDGRRFLWTSERNGWRNLYLYDLNAGLVRPLTQHDFEVGEVVRVDETARQVYYMARDGDNR